MDCSTPAFHVVWHGALIGFVNTWSKTLGELSPPREQRERPTGWDPPDPLAIDGFGLPRQPPAVPSSSLQVQGPESEVRRPAARPPPRPRSWLVPDHDEPGDWFL